MSVTCVWFSALLWIVPTCVPLYLVLVLVPLPLLDHDLSTGSCHVVPVFAKVFSYFWV